MPSVCTSRPATLNVIGVGEKAFGFSTQPRGFENIDLPGTIYPA